MASTNEVAALKAVLSPEHLDELEGLFQVFELRPNRMSCTDLPIAFQMLGTMLSKEQVQAFVTLYSADGKYFNKEEFLEIAGEVVLTKSDEDKVKMLEHAYDHLFDVHGSGSVTSKQLHRVLAQLNTSIAVADAGQLEDVSEEALDALIKDLDKDGLGITKHMFVDMLKESPSIL